MFVICAISLKCQRTPLRPPKRLDCESKLYDDTLYFRCVCAHAQSLTDNPYFSARCVYQECGIDWDRQVFINAYRKGCVDIGHTLRDITGEWAPFALSSTGIPKETSSSTSGVGLQSSSVTRTAVMASSTTLFSTETMTVTLTEATEMTSSTAVSSTLNTTTTTTQSPTSTSTRITAPAAAVSTNSANSADVQIPICGIPQKCAKPQSSGHPTCAPSNLSCICAASQSLARNTLFDQQCVYDSCYGDLGKEEFLESLIYNCGKVGVELTDIPKRWEVYLPPSWTTPSPSPSTTPSPSPSNSSEPEPPDPSTATTSSGKERQRPLSTPAIAGTAAAASLTLVLLALLALLYARWKKKAKRLRVENAVLVDATNPQGVGGRIGALMDGRAGEGGFEEEGTLVGSPTGESFGVGGARYSAAAGAGGMRIEEKNYNGYGPGPGYGPGNANVNGEPDFELNTWERRYTTRSPPLTPNQQPTSPNIGFTRRAGSSGPPPSSPPPPPPVPRKSQSPRVYDDEESEYESLRRERRVVRPTSRSPPPPPPKVYDDGESEYESFRRGGGGRMI